MAESCTNCKIGVARHGSARFPSVNLCFSCVRDFLGWMVDQGVADGNPLVAALWYVTPSLFVKSAQGGYSWVQLNGFEIVPTQK